MRDRQNAKELPKEVVIQDLLSVYNEQGKLTRDIYKQYGKYSWPMVEKVFKCKWNNILPQLGIEPYMRKNISKEEIIEDMLLVYGEHGKLTKDIYNENGKYGTSTVHRKLGNWNAALEIAKIPINCEINIPDDDLIAELRRLYDVYGQLTADIIKQKGKYTIEVYVRRFGLVNAYEIAGIPEHNLYGFSKSADIVIRMFEKILGETAEREKQFDWLVNPKTGRKLFIDAYFPKSNICLEYNGEQHYRELAFGRDDLSTIQYRDEVKYQLVKQNGLKLIIIRYDDEICEQFFKNFIE